MKLYLVQHGKSKSETEDIKKPLSEEGIEETRKIALFFKEKMMANIGHILCSTKQRAMDTARIMSDMIANESIDMIVRNDMAPNDPIEPLMRDLEIFTIDTMIVGHLPYLQKFASFLLNENETQTPIQFQNSAIICFEGSQRNWKITEMITPRMC